MSVLPSIGCPPFAALKLRMLLSCQCLIVLYGAGKGRVWVRLDVRGVEEIGAMGEKGEV